jgi:hypothetical protein
MLFHLKEKCEFHDMPQEIDGHTPLPCKKKDENVQLTNFDDVRLVSPSRQGARVCHSRSFQGSIISLIKLRSITTISISLLKSKN